eukprot:7908-Heterococcus_DN1.PRE.3
MKVHGDDRHCAWHYRADCKLGEVYLVHAEAKPSCRRQVQKNGGESPSTPLNARQQSAAVESLRALSKF